MSLPTTLARRMSKSRTGLPPPKISERSFEYTIGSFEIPHLTSTPWELDRLKRPSTNPRGQPTPAKEFSAHYFRDMPREIYDCIVVQLEELHLNRDGACSSCYLRDMSSLSLTSRGWDRAATLQLYRAVIIPTHDCHTPMSNPQSTGLTRLKKLRRTLRNHPTLARYVLELHLGEIHTLYEKAELEKQEIVNQVASLVMATPNLERLVGFQVPLTQSFDRLSHALSTRRNLREKILLLDEGNGGSASQEEDDAIGPYYHESHDPTERFLLLNSNHEALSTLVLQQEQGQISSYLNFRSIIGTLRLLPNLRHLVLSGLAASVFTNLALGALPAGLQSLRLENLAGVNDRGLQRFVQSRHARSLKKLTLINLSLKSITTLSDIFSANLPELKSFIIAQDRAPAPTAYTTVPGFRSPNLHFMHWEFRSEAGPPPRLPTSSSCPNPTEQLRFPFKTAEPISCLATSLLCTSIRDRAFPSLRRIRIPHDPQGLVQDLCKPLAAALAPHEVASLTVASRISSSNGFDIEIGGVPCAAKVDSMLVTAHARSSARVDAVTGSSLSTSSRDAVANQWGLSPLRSRVAAHVRILAARREEAMAIRVVGPDGRVCVDSAMGGYMGDVASRISYQLEADRSWISGNSGCESSDRSEWLTDVCGLVGGVQTDEQRRGGCRHAVGRAVGRGVVSNRSGP